MKRGHVPLRTCRVCRRRAPKGELQRLVAVGGQLVDDAQQRLAGRGVYCCPDGACRERLLHKLKKSQQSNIRPSAATKTRHTAAGGGNTVAGAEENEGNGAGNIQHADRSPL